MCCVCAVRTEHCTNKDNLTRDRYSVPLHVTYTPVERVLHACLPYRFVAHGIIVIFIVQKRMNEQKCRIKIFTMCREQLKKGDKSERNIHTHTHSHIKCIEFGFGPYATIYTVHSHNSHVLIHIYVYGKSTHTHCH